MMDAPEDDFFERLASAEDSTGNPAPSELKDRLFSALSEDALLPDLPAEPAVSAPSTLKSKIYSALVSEQGAQGPLLSLSGCKQRGRPLCVFETLVEISPVGEAAKSVNYCRICHARVMAEHLESAPIYWPGCPYVGFRNAGS